MTSPESVALIRRAKAGDREAWEALCRRYYPKWLDQFHGKLRPELRRLYDTQDLVQSAVREAVRDIQGLRKEGAFYAWVCAIIRHKIGEKAKHDGKYPMISLDAVEELSGSEARSELRMATEEEYLQSLDVILMLFPDYQEEMGAFYLRHFEDLDAPAISAVLGASERQVYRWIESGRMLLRSKLPGM